MDLDIVSKQADKFFIYASCEHNLYSFDFFVGIDNKYYYIHQLNSTNNNFFYDLSNERIFAALEDGVNEIKFIKFACEKYQMEMSTEMKLVYDVKTNSLETTLAHA